jgi:hypothetical protein
MGEPRFKTRTEYEAWKAAQANDPMARVGEAMESALERAVTTERPAPKGRLRRIWREIPLLGKVLLVFMGLAILGVGGQQTATRSTIDKNPYAGWSACQRAVTDRLKAPSTAKFIEPKISPGPSPDQRMIFAAVDSQNSFGAMLRTQFICEVRRVGNGWTADVTFAKD